MLYIIPSLNRPDDTPSQWKWELHDERGVTIAYGPGVVSREEAERDARALFPAEELEHLHPET